MNYLIESLKTKEQAFYKNHSNHLAHVIESINSLVALRNTVDCMPSVTFHVDNLSIVVLTHAQKINEILIERESEINVLKADSFEYNKVEIRNEIDFAIKFYDSVTPKLETIESMLLGMRSLIESDDSNHKILELMTHLIQVANQFLSDFHERIIELRNELIRLRDSIPLDSVKTLKEVA